MRLKIKGKIFSVLILVLFFVISTEFTFGDEVTELWARLYNRAQTYQQKYEIMLNIVEIQNRDMIPTYINALSNLTQAVNISKNDLEIVKKLEVLIIKQLGNLKASGASDLIFDVMRNSKDPFVKSEALISLGKIGAKKYAQDIVVMLKSLTLYRGAENVQGQDSIAYGCIYALERFKDTIGYLPVFLAANGGYSRFVKDAAKKALVNMVDDPSSILDGIIRYESSPKLKIAALELEDNSKVSENKKIDVSTTALEVGLSVEPANIAEGTNLRDLRIYALRMFIKYKAKNDKAVPYMEKILYRSKDISEKIYAVRALSVMNTKDSVSVLARFLAYNNNRMGAGVNMGDDRLVIETIRAIGSTKNSIGYEELMRVKYSNYSIAVSREAEKALKQMGKK